MVCTWSPRCCPSAKLKEWIWPTPDVPVNHCKQPVGALFGEEQGISVVWIENLLFVTAAATPFAFCPKLKSKVWQACDTSK